VVVESSAARNGKLGPKSGFRWIINLMLDLFTLGGLFSHYRPRDIL